jgi:hypothetical protein
VRAFSRRKSGRYAAQSCHMPVPISDLDCGINAVARKTKIKFRGNIAVPIIVDGNSLLPTSCVVSSRAARIMRPVRPLHPEDEASLRCGR